MMQFIRRQLPTLRPIRLLFAIFASAFLLFSYAVPAYAASSSPTSGETQMKRLEQKSLDILEEGGPSGMEKVQAETQGKGLNMVQGDADIDKMKRPENSSSAAPSVEQVVQKNLEKIQGKSND